MALSCTDIGITFFRISHYNDKIYTEYNKSSISQY